MAIKELMPRKPQPSKIGQCSAPVPPPKYNVLWRKERWHGRSGWNDDLCQRFASVEIDGRMYCRSHGGQVALDQLLRATPHLEALRGMEADFECDAGPLSALKAWLSLKDILGIGR